MQYNENRQRRLRWPEISNRSVHGATRIRSTVYSKYYSTRVNLRSMAGLRRGLRQRACTLAIWSAKNARGSNRGKKVTSLFAQPGVTMTLPAMSPR